jgi:hypothetical protein
LFVDKHLLLQTILSNINLELLLKLKNLKYIKGNSMLLGAILMSVCAFILHKYKYENSKKVRSKSEVDYMWFYMLCFIKLFYTPNLNLLSALK